MKTFGITRKTAQKSAAVVTGRPATHGARVGTQLP
jgi:hypothetical protein